MNNDQIIDARYWQRELQRLMTLLYDVQVAEGEWRIAATIEQLMLLHDWIQFELEPEKASS